MQFRKTAETKEGDATAHAQAEAPFSLSTKRLLVKQPRPQVLLLLLQQSLQEQPL